MANKKTNEEVFYIVMTKELPLESGDGVTVHDRLDKAYFNTMEAWIHDGISEYVAYEVKKIGEIKVTTEK